MANDSARIDVDQPISDCIISRHSSRSATAAERPVIGTSCKHAHAPCMMTAVGQADSVVHARSSHAVQVVCMHEGRLHRAGLSPRFYVRQSGSSVALACKKISTPCALLYAGICYLTSSRTENKLRPSNPVGSVDSLTRS